MMLSVEHYKELLTKNGLKVTSQRLAVLQVLYEDKTHPDTERIYEQVRQRLPAISKATVYSTLISLTDAGLIRQMETADEVKRYDAECGCHPHLVCLGCNKIEDLDKWEKSDIIAFESRVGQMTDYTIVRSSLSFYGWCPSCQKNNP